MPIQVEVEIDHGIGNLGADAAQIVEASIRTILRRESFADDQPTSFTVLLTSDERLRQLNRDHAGDDYVTDVLSFEAQSDDEFPTFAEDESVVRIGDIAISIPQTKRQASEKSVAFEHELAMLAIHGTLHLLGYDHASPDEERVMFGKTDDALAEIFDQSSRFERRANATCCAGIPGRASDQQERSRP